MAVPTKQCPDVQTLAPYAALGNIRFTRDQSVIIQVVGNARYWEFHAFAAETLFPECPELALLHPVLTFNTAERARLAFYETLDLGKLDEGVPDVRYWAKKLPVDDGIMYQVAARLCKW